MTIFSLNSKDLYITIILLHLRQDIVQTRGWNHHEVPEYV